MLTPDAETVTARYAPGVRQTGCPAEGAVLAGDRSRHRHPGVALGAALDLHRLARRRRAHSELESAGLPGRSSDPGRRPRDGHPDGRSRRGGRLTGWECRSARLRPHDDVDAAPHCVHVHPRAGADLPLKLSRWPGRGRARGASSPGPGGCFPLRSAAGRRSRTTSSAGRARSGAWPRSPSSSPTDRSAAPGPPGRKSLRAPEATTKSVMELGARLPRARFSAAADQTQSRPLLGQSSSASVDPQTWCGEMASKASSTPTRYGMAGGPHSSSREAVFPPEVEWYTVHASAPSDLTTSPRVASTAALARESSARIPP